VLLGKRLGASGGRRVGLRRFGEGESGLEEGRGWI